MEFEALVKARRSIRRFENRKVEAEKIAKLIEMARLCQSAKNRQPWRFLVLEGAEKDAVADLMFSLRRKNHEELTGFKNTSANSALIIKNASVVILVFKEKDDEWLTGDLLSIGAAVEHICLEAVNQGLGSVWIRDVAYTKFEIAQLTGHMDLELISAVAVGYAAEAPLPRPRKTTKEILLNK